MAKRLTYRGANNLCIYVYANSAATSGTLCRVPGLISVSLNVSGSDVFSSRTRTASQYSELATVELEIAAVTLSIQTMLLNNIIAIGWSVAGGTKDTYLATWIRYCNNAGMSKSMSTNTENTVWDTQTYTFTAVKHPSYAMADYKKEVECNSKAALNTALSTPL